METKKYKYVTRFTVTLAGLIIVAGVGFVFYVFVFHGEYLRCLHPLLVFLLLVLYIVLLAFVAANIAGSDDAIKDYLYRHQGRWLPRRTINFK